MSDIKLCIDCKHLEPDMSFSNAGSQRRYGFCGLTGQQSLVDGSIKIIIAGMARNFGNKCGPDANLFEPKSADDGTVPF